MALSRKTGRPAKNRYDVAVWYWDNWSNAQRAHFNRLYKSLRQEEVVPFSMPLLSRETWGELRWNIALTSTEAYE